MLNQIIDKVKLGDQIDLKRKKRLRVYANALTLFRLAIGLPVIISLSNQNLSLAWFLLFLGGLSDFADGFFARKAGDSSDWGARLDPLADKILILAPLLWLSSNSVLPIWSIWLLITRELIISLWRSSQRKGVAAALSGKIKTTLQFISILLMIWPERWGGLVLAASLQQVGWYIFWVSLFTALVSAVKYLNFKSKFDLS